MIALRIILIVIGILQTLLLFSKDEDAESHSQPYVLEDTDLFIPYERLTEAFWNEKAHQHQVKKQVTLGMTGLTVPGTLFTHLGLVVITSLFNRIEFALSPLSYTITWSIAIVPASIRHSRYHNRLLQTALWLEDQALQKPNYYMEEINQQLIYQYMALESHRRISIRMNAVRIWRRASLVSMMMSSPLLFTGIRNSDPELIGISSANAIFFGFIFGLSCAVLHRLKKKRDSIQVIFQETGIAVLNPYDDSPITFTERMEESPKPAAPKRVKQPLEQKEKRQLAFLSGVSTLATILGIAFFVGGKSHPNYDSSKFYALGGICIGFGTLGILGSIVQAIRMHRKQKEQGEVNPKHTGGNL
jgi:hypothetical protein